MASLFGEGGGGDGAEAVELVPLKGEPPRVSVRVGGRRVATLLHRTAVELDLRAGQSLDEGLLERVRRGERVDRAVRDLGRMTGRRGLSRAAARERLAAKGYEAEEADAACRRAEAVGLLDDARLGRELAEEALRRGPVGRSVLEGRLRKAGLGEETIRGVLDEAMAGREAIEDATELARRRAAAQSERVPRARLAARLLAMLGRKGYDEETARAAVERALGTRLEDLGPDKTG